MGRFSVVFILSVGLSALQQGKDVGTRPNLSGHWRVDETQSQLNGSTAWFGNDLVVTQNEKTVTFAAQGGGPGTGSLMYPTDGTETRRQPRADATNVDKAIWKGNQLVITTAITEGKWSSNRTVTVVLGRDDSLVVDVVYSPPARSQFATHSVYRRTK